VDTFLAAITTRARSRRNARTVCLLGAVLLAGFAAASNARAADAARCGAAPTTEEVLERLNEARQRGAACQRTGAPTRAEPLRWNENLAAAAAAQSREMAELDHMSHRDSHDRGLPERLTQMGYRFSAAAENVAVGYSSLDAVIEAWLRSESHCDNLMNAKVRELGLACVDAQSARGADNVAEGRYWTLILGAQRRQR
jgi:uncharacterized protein YkwD